MGQRTFTKNLVLRNRGRAPASSTRAPSLTCAITIEYPKTAALLFDKVYSSHIAETPAEITPGWAMFGDAEISGSAMTAIRFAPSRETLASDIANRPLVLAKKLESRGFIPVPYYEREQDMLGDYKPGSRPFVGCALESVLVVEESALVWDQVQEFRADEDAQRDYRKLMHWFDKEMVSKSIEFAQDELEGKYERYQAALRKHGVQARWGELFSLYNTLPGLVTGALTAAATTVPVVGLLVAGVLIGGQTFAKLRQINLEAEHERVAGPNSELAFVHRINSLEAVRPSAPSAPGRYRRLSIE